MRNSAVGLEWPMSSDSCFSTREYRPNGSRLASTPLCHDVFCKVAWFSSLYQRENTSCHMNFPNANQSLTINLSWRDSNEFQSYRPSWQTSWVVFTKILFCQFFYFETNSLFSRQLIPVWRSVFKLIYLPRNYETPARFQTLSSDC